MNATSPEREAQRLVVVFLRARHRRSREQFGKLVGLDRRTIGRYETGDVLPPRPTLDRLAATVGVGVSRLDQLLALFGRICAESATSAERATTSARTELATEITAALEVEILAALADLPFEDDEVAPSRS
jgi:transcriptional regulator with XRE-family HTH domain